MWPNATADDLASMQRTALTIAQAARETYEQEPDPAIKVQALLVAARFQLQADEIAATLR